MKKSQSFLYASQPDIDYKIFLITLTVVGCITLIAQSYTSLGRTLLKNKEALASTTVALENSNARFFALVKEYTDLQANFGVQIAKNDYYGQQINALSSTVGQLYKLSQTDKELLQKYSDVYFLNENYVPSALSPIDTQYLNRPDKIESIHSNIKIYLENLLRDANANGTQLQIFSAYRSFGTQATLKASYKQIFGKGTANQFSADQGYSEHQLGSTVDFTTPQIGQGLTGFEKTPASDWLLANAYKYGFELSYPKGNKYFEYEPWHWRFVGVELATRLHNEGKNFYDLDQRDIDTYLVKIFD